MTEYKFTIIIERQPEGEDLVSVPALLGCYTEGQTLEEARANAEDAIQVYCESLPKHGEALPSEQSIEHSIGQLTVL